MLGLKSYRWVSLSLLFCFFGFVKGQEKVDPIAENMLLLQRSYGGWSKFFNKQKVDYNHVFSPSDMNLAKHQKDALDATIDNNATSSEIRYLIKAYKKTQNKSYLTAVEKGIDYLLEAQYPNGGWPQYYPDTHLYRSEITYNDCAMINVLRIMQDISKAAKGFEILKARYKEKAQRAIVLGVDCILKTQVIIGGQKTIWAAQYDKDRLQPAKARAYELPSLATAESSDILLFLMEQPPSPRLVEAVEAGVKWFAAHKIENKEALVIDDSTQKSGKDRILVTKQGATSWARFYDLKQQEPLFVGRDGVPHRTLSSIENERRIGYAWYGNWGDKVERAYKK
ncbi:pectate lyase [Olivibacter sp. CPCC 100613]|uniref:pectate lyase n=1 Tax=Olivibacter sp. CPCC 100613 TaxID=3079931 RepID=UPI002FFAF8A4